MCLYPRQMKNKKYTVTAKNGGCVPTFPVIGKDENGWNIYDERVANIQIPCGHCQECREEKARNWQVRLSEEIKEWKYKYFITLTFSNNALKNIIKKTNNIECNAAAAYALRHCLERYRKEHKKSLRHWMITELGHEGTERIHMHGILFSNEPLEFIPTKEKNFYTWKYWKYGHIFVGQYVNLQTVNYIVKYCSKIDTDHLGFEGQVLCSPGIGKAFTEREIAKTYKYKPNQSKDYYRLNNGAKIKLPVYYKNKFYNEDEREKQWREKMDEAENKTYIAGNNYDMVSIKPRTLSNVLEKAKEINIKRGYGTDEIKYRKKEYNITKRMLRRAEAKADLIQKYQESLKKMQKNLRISK